MSAASCNYYLGLVESTTPGKDSEAMHAHDSGGRSMTETTNPARMEKSFCHDSW